MSSELSDLTAFVAVAQAGGFRDAARGGGASASSLSEAIRRLEAKLGVRLLNRNTRSVVPTEAGTRLLERLVPALNEVDAALDVVNGFRDRPAGTLKLNVPVSAARLILPYIVPGFLAAYPNIRLEVIAEDNFVDMLAEGCDAGIRYDDRLEQDMVAIPFGPREQRFATAAAPSYLAQRGVPRASARSPRSRLSAWPLCERRAHQLGVRTRRRDRQDRAHGITHRSNRRRNRPRGRSRHCRQRRHTIIRGLAAPSFTDRRTTAVTRAMVAAIHRPFPLLSQPPPYARTAARLHRLQSRAA
jgi:DNA-binding transcriptional LysR family regulator